MENVTEKIPPLEGNLFNLIACLFMATDPTFPC